MCTFQLWHLFLTWQACFPAPDSQIHLRRHRRDEVTRMIYGVATWGKAVCVLGSLGEFTKGCATMSASSDTLAFPADKPTEADSQRAFCAFQPPWKKADSSLKCWSSRGPECSLILLSERKHCCCAAKLTRLFKNCFNPFCKVIEDCDMRPAGSSTVLN